MTAHSDPLSPQWVLPSRESGVRGLSENSCCGGRAASLSRLVTGSRSSGLPLAGRCGGAAGGAGGLAERRCRPSRVGASRSRISRKRSAAVAVKDRLVSTSVAF